MPSKIPDTQAIHMLMEKEILDLVEEYRFEHRFHTRTETIKAMIRAASKGEGKEKAAKRPRKPAASER